jgi:hypothetical protein
MKNSSMNPKLNISLPPLPGRMNHLPLNLNDLYWAAGFIEGEGTFTHGGSFGVVASQVQLWPLERLQTLFGGSISTNGRPPRSHHQQCHVWYLHGYKAAGLAMTLWMLMSPRRRQQIERALKKWSKQKIANGMRTRCPRGHSYRPLANGGGRYCPICTSEHTAHYQKNRKLRRMALHDSQQPRLPLC